MHRSCASCVKKLTVATALFLIPIAVAHAQDTRPLPAVGRPWRIAQVDSAVEASRQAWGIPGIAIAIVHRDSVLLAKGYGVREAGRPERVDAHTLFDAASLTKAFTAAAIGSLVDEGRMRWDDPVRRHLPTLEFSTPTLTAEVTLRDLLSHRAALQSATASWYFTHVDRAEVLRRARFLQPAMPFRTGMLYSNIGYTIAGEAAAAAARSTWETLVRTRLLEPLGMTRTLVSYGAAAPDANVASPHVAMDGAQRAVAREGPARDVIAAAGGIQSSATDLARWMRFQLGDGTFEGRRILSAAALAETHAPQVIVPTTPAFRRARHLRYGAAYGLGWQVWDYRGRPLLWHSGSGDGQFAYMALYPDDSLGIVVLLNSWVLTNTPPVHGMIAGCIADALLALAPPNCVGDAVTLRAGDPARWQETMRTFDAARIPNTSPSRPLSAYAGQYADSLYGPLEVRADGGGLVLRAGPSGETADLEHWHLDTFRVQWRRPLQRMYFMALATFRMDAQGRVVGIQLRMRNDEVTAARVAPAQR